MQKNKTTAIINIILVCLLVVFIGATAFIIISKSTSPSDNDTTVSQTDYIQDVFNRRQSMSDEARSLAESGTVQGKVFEEAMNRHISAATSDDMRSSLEYYLIFLAIRHSFLEDADTLISEKLNSDNELSNSQLCELYEYETLLSVSYHSNAISDAEEKRSYYCEQITSEEDYVQMPSEEDSDYALRLFYEGYITDAVPLLVEAYNSLEDEDKKESIRLILADYYMIKKDPENYLKYGSFEQ